MALVLENARRSGRTAGAQQWAAVGILDHLDPLALNCHRSLMSPATDTRQARSVNALRLRASPQAGALSSCRGRER